MKADPGTNPGPDAPDRQAGEVARRCAILAGGAGRRIGGEKARAALAGRPLIAYAIDAARKAGLAPFVVAKPSTPLPSLDCPLAAEPESPRHPLVGIVLALQLYVEPIVVAPCDMPLLDPRLLVSLARAGGELTVVTGAGSIHPLLGRWSPALLSALRERLEAPAPMREIVLDLGAGELDADESLGAERARRALLNVNTAGDLALAASSLPAG